MRRLLLILAAMIVAAIGFVLYIAWQTPGGHANTDGNTADTHLHPSTLTAGDSLTGMGPARGITWVQYDNNGNRTSIFSATKATPRAAGSLVDMEAPSAEFFLAEGRRMVLTGDTGVINMEQRPAAHKTMTGGNSDAAPTNGFLFNVIVKVFEKDAPDHPTMTLTTNNLSFDNQTFRIATESYTTADNHLISADQVPVQVRGDQVDFDGRGLVARYDDYNERIALLQIAHGEQMVLKHVEGLAGATTKPAKSINATSSGTSPWPDVLADASPVGSALADRSAENDSMTDGPPRRTPQGAVLPLAQMGDASSMSPPDSGGKRSKAGSPTSAPGKSRKSATSKPGRLPPTAYRATFFDEVHVTQDHAPLAESDVMAVDFMPNQAGSGTTKPSGGATAKPVKPPTTSHTKIAKGAKSAATSTAPASTGPTTESTTRSADSQPTTTAATGPTYPPGAIVVKWTGQMRLVAVDRNTVVPLLPGDSAITANGNPVVLHQPSGVAKCASMLYASSDKSLHLRTSTTMPTVTFDDTPGQTHLVCAAADYADATRTGLVTGPATLTMDQPSKMPGQPPTHTMVSWTDRAVAKLFDAQSNAIQHIDVTGDVHVNNPQMKMVSDKIALAFLPDKMVANKSDLSQMLATGAVEADLSDALHPGRRLTSDELIVNTIARPTGGVFPKEIFATGHAHATDADQAITADAMHATLAPKAPSTQPVRVATTLASASGKSTTKPADPLAAAGEQAELQTFVATGGVVMSNADSHATADRVSMDQTTGHAHIELDGAPASVTQQGRTITGPIITAQPDEGLAAVQGAGTIHAIVDSATTKPATAAGVTKLPDLTDANVSRDRSARAVPLDIAADDHKIVPLADTAAAPTTRRTGRAAATTRPTTRPIDIAWAGGANFDGPNNQVLVEDHVVIDTRDADGTTRHATCDAMEITLRHATTRPARSGGRTPARVSPTTRASRHATTQPGTIAANGFKDKAVAAVMLKGNVIVDSSLISPAGDVESRSRMQTEKLIANLDDQEQLANIDVPVPGQAFVQDFRPARPPQNGAANPGMSGNGATAIGWSKSFRLDETPEKVATFTGDPLKAADLIHVHHDAATGPGADSLDLTASKLIVTFKPDVKPPHAATQPTAKPTTKPIGPSLTGVQQVYAVSPVNVKTATMDLTARALQFTPDDHLAVLTGSDRQPIEGVYGDQKGHVSFQRAVIDTQTQLIIDSTGVQATGGR